MPLVDPERPTGELVEGVHGLLVGGALAVRTGPGADQIFGICLPHEDAGWSP